MGETQDVSIKAKPIAAVCDELKLQLHSKNIKNVTAPAILIAGCGTGQQSIGTASRFSNCHVTCCGFKPCKPSLCTEEI